VSNLAEQQGIQFETNLRQVVNRFQALIIKTARSGYMFSVNADERIRYAPELYSGLVDALQQSGYLSLVSDLIEQDRELIAEVKSLRTAKGLPTQFSKQSSEALAAFQNLEFAQFQNISTGFVNSLHQELMNYALTGVDEAVFIESIRNMLESKLQKYATTYAYTSRAKWIQQVQDEAAKNYDDELFWEYVGPEDDRTRDACIEGLNQQYFTDAERMEFEARTADERAWNCRHVFVQITKEDYEKGIK